jgi:iron complex transport system ATP-binding protein
LSAIRVRGVSVYFGGFQALRSVELEVGEGEFLAVIGPNGSGKTTLLRTIVGVLRPRVGSVYIYGKELQECSRLELARRLGYVPQGLERQKFLTVLEFVLTGRRPYISFDYSRVDYEKAMEALRRVNAEHLAARTLDTLSGGEFQRVVIARALAGEPEVLVLDEPTSNLDPRFQLEIMNMLRGLTGDRITVVSSMHDLTQAYRYADKVVALKDGRIYAMGRPEEVLTEDNLQKIYGVKVKVFPEYRAVVLDNILWREL